MPYDARAVANFILDLAEAESRPVTQVYLLKLIYFAHGWYLASKNSPLISQPIEAWQYGPVIKVVRDAFKEFGGKPISSRADKLDLLTGEIIKVVPDLKPDDAEFIRSVYKNYSHYGAWDLSDLTHEKGSPWDKVWNPKVAKGRLGLRIRNDEIRSHFLNIAARRHQKVFPRS